MPNVSNDNQTELKSIFEAVKKSISEFVHSELNTFLEVMSADCMDCFKAKSQEQDEWRKAREAVLDLTLDVLKDMKKDCVADILKNRLLAPVCQCQLKSTFKLKFQSVFEGLQETGKTTPLNEIYTELYVIEGETVGTKEHEVTQIQMRPSRAITTLKSTDVFSLHGTQQRVRTVLTKGVAGIGKTLLTQKFSLDWAEGTTNQNIHFIFPFTFRELNPLRGDSISLNELIGHFFTETNQGICRFEEFQCLFIFDGLDECRLELDFNKTQSVTDVREKTSVEVLLVNIISGTLLPSALIWITSRPAAASLIPAVCVDMVTEVRGFDDPQKEIYFRKKFKNEEEASKVLSHVRASPNVFNMCSIPVFCWITAKVMDNILQTEEGRLPQTLTELYIHFLVVQSKVTNVKYKDKSKLDLHWSPERRNCIMLLSKLAFEQLLRGNLIFYESDLTDCGINITEASVYSGLFSQMFKEEKGLYRDKVFSFVHLSVQEFLAALHVHVTFMDYGVNLLTESVWYKLFGGRSSVIQFYKTAVDKAVESPNGHLDLFLRFLLGLSLECNQSLLRGLVRQTGSPQINKETGEYLKTMLDSGLSIERNLTLLQCLNELKDSSLCEEVQAWLSSEKIPSDPSPAQWSALVSILLSLEEPEFDLTKYQPSETALLMLMPVVKQSSTALLSGCGLSDKACVTLSSELSSQCSVTELDLSNNLLKDSGLQLICEGLKSSSCALHTLSLRQCGLSSTSCEALVSVLVSDSNSLTELDLSNNDLLDSGVKILCSDLKNPLCKLETLRLSGCQVSKSGCASLISALSSETSCLTELDLSYNHPGETEAKQLTALFQDPQKKLSLEHGGVERLRGGFSKYACHLTFDLNSANKRIKVSDNNRRITVEQEKQAYPDHSERFDNWKQVLCSEGLTGRKYWEVEVRGDVYIAVTYKSIKRRGTGEESCFGKNAQSWSLGSSEDQTLSVLHQNRRRSLKKKESERIGVYLDWDSGLLSFYEVSSEQKTHLHTIKTRFTEKVYPAFRIKTKPVNSSVTLCTV
uniref:NACHT, LRR and PYD domains-containing protein 12-like n=1 Tax=Neogobius melanostomus TaxID=47308 RepID=A0A8C6TTI4_9GOBI